MKGLICSLKQSRQKGTFPKCPKQEKGLRRMQAIVPFESNSKYEHGKRKTHFIMEEEAVFVFTKSRGTGARCAVAKQDAHTPNKRASALNAGGREFAIMEFLEVGADGGVPKFSKCCSQLRAQHGTVGSLRHQRQPFVQRKSRSIALEEGFADSLGFWYI
jgi:hypothetical protein